MITYKATGIVLGNLWGGRIGGYAAQVITATSKDYLFQQIEDGIADGSLDSGMGYESLIGALMAIEIIDSREMDGKIFVHRDYEDEFFGDITPEQEEMLSDMKF